MAVVGVYGTQNIRFSLKEMPDGNLSTFELAPFEANATTLEDAIKAYDHAFGTQTTKYDGSNPDIPFKDGVPKYFCHKYKFRGEDDLALVDIHVERRGIDICPKQDLAFLLEDGDVITFGLLAC